MCIRDRDITTDRTVTIAGVDQLRARFNANAWSGRAEGGYRSVSYTHLRAHETVLDLVCRLLLEKKNKQTTMHPNTLTRTYVTL